MRRGASIITRSGCGDEFPLVLVARPLPEKNSFRGGGTREGGTREGGTRGWHARVARARVAREGGTGEGVGGRSPWKLREGFGKQEMHMVPGFGSLPGPARSCPCWRWRAGCRGGAGRFRVHRQPAGRGPSTAHRPECTGSRQDVSPRRPGHAHSLQTFATAHSPPCRSHWGNGSPGGSRSQANK